jgi:hypothetical protein
MLRLSKPARLDLEKISSFMDGHYLAVPLLLLVLLLFGAFAPVQVARAQCELDATQLYRVFKQYREHLNRADHWQQLTPYFSNAFNQYYTSKLGSADAKSRYLAHYWDNMNTAQDIVIIYAYTAQCRSQAQQATLTLLVVLDRPFSEPSLLTQPALVDLWNVKVYYVKEDGRWLIDSFEYNKSRSQQTFKESQIVDNFAVIR